MVPLVPSPRGELVPCSGDGSRVLREAVSTKSNRCSQILRVPQTAGLSQTSRPVTSAEAGGSGDAFPALQHFSRLSVDRANQLYPGPSIPVRRSPFLISKGPSRLRAIQFIIYLVQQRSVATLLEEPPRQGPVVCRWVAQYKSQTDPIPPCHLLLIEASQPSVHLRNNYYHSTSGLHSAADGLDYLCECSWGPRRSSAVLFHVSTQTQPLPRPCMLYHNMARYVRHIQAG